MSGRSALVFGGTGTVGAEILRELSRRGISAAFSFHSNEAKARALAAELGHEPFALDVSDPAALRDVLDGRPTPDLVIYCAGTTVSQPLVELDVASWQRGVAINVHAPIQICQWLARRRGADPSTSPIDVVVVGGLDRTQSLPLPVGYAATQGALAAAVMALGHELGPVGIRVNMVALGVLEGGTSRDLASRRRRDYETFSALRRIGTAAEVTKTIVWLALENTYIQGKVLPVNGGI